MVAAPAPEPVELTCAPDWMLMPNGVALELLVVPLTATAPEAEVTFVPVPKSPVPSEFADVPVTATLPPVDFTWLPLSTRIPRPLPVLVPWTVTVAPVPEPDELICEPPWSNTPSMPTCELLVVPV